MVFKILDIRQWKMMIPEDGKPMRQPWRWHQLFDLRNFSGRSKERRESNWSLAYILSWGNRDETHWGSPWVVIRELINVHVRGNYQKPRKEHTKGLEGTGPSTYTELGTVSVTTSQTGISDNSSGIQ